jgi:hypothetical protein
MDQYGQGYGELNVYPIDTDWYDPDVYLYTYALAPGQTALDSVGPPPGFWEPEPFGSDFVKIYSGDAKGYSSGGTVTLTHVSQPTDERWGEIHGSAQADLTFWEYSQYTWTVTEIGTLTMEFAVPNDGDDGFWTSQQAEIADHPLLRRFFREPMETAKPDRR